MMPGFWPVLMVCLATAAGPKLCGERVYSPPLPTYLECALTIAELQPIYEPKRFRCVEGSRPDLPALQLVPAGQHLG